MTTSFPSFPDLPPELRNKVWREALPTDVGPSLYFYREKRYWRSRRLKESDPQFIKGVGEMALDFRTDLLGGDKEFHVPLAFVNQEARGIALCWLDEQGITIKQSQPRRCLFKRPFDCASDTLYVPDNKWDDFYEEPSDRIGEPDLVNQSVDVNGEISRIAISETLYMKDDVIRWLPGLNSWWDVTVIFVVVGAQPDPQQGSCRWELEGTDGRAIVCYTITKLITMHAFKSAIFFIFALLSACAFATFNGKFNIVNYYEYKKAGSNTTELQRNTALFPRKLKSEKTLHLIVKNLNSWTGGEFTISEQKHFYEAKATRNYKNRGDAADSVQRCKSAISKHANDE
ncbi:hypothetical protein LMH87_001639 [Akanthomyces muscarius]|uniref:2EXR domain-containing protein n=1 Tax=Akanthomyces muscarius TaxID=2231603 RepID=A0A9W8Q803_AKAMU|nr:hypothetical protein LMH87_001639 [Akanthomyces muscarius]KAJ4147091.1 hypothetical protein LMH87_001639 [Akanthomyces muscarius]